MPTPDLFSELESGPAEVPAPTPACGPVLRSKKGRKPLKEDGDLAVLHAFDASKLQKQYYSISEVADMFHVNASQIRYWENEFDILKPKKNRKGDRLFRPEDIANLQLIYHLIRERKFTLEGAKRKLREDLALSRQRFEMIQSLERIRGFLVALKEKL